MSAPTPKIYVFCNTRCGGRGDWHSMVAIAEDGTGLAGHICSSHRWAFHDMGIDPEGWKRDIYAKHYPEGFEVCWVGSEEIDSHEGLRRAFALHEQKTAAIAKAEGH